MISGFDDSDLSRFNYQLDRTPLMVCAEHNNLRLLKALLERGADYELVTNAYETLLELAARKNNIRVIEVRRTTCDV